ncbi:hypothetical protein Pan44_26720 [Caulifigura coniformis]|uniref:Uncharacterized protein n=1 Tax=Caulifigura coniformis TaxID=2527983 RepID=A0A517SEW9_9PLAN|nr:hypothetical protein [Caulifigura coniformis]QDT54637.1 hypothetical protein Pan44_26720 [Caulifigura coniformis]
MTPDLGIELCDALVTDLNDPAITWVSPFTAARGFSPRVEAEVLNDTTFVVAYPAGDRRTLFERGEEWNTQPTGAITVLRRLPILEGTGIDEYEDTALPDELMALVGQLKGRFGRKEGYGLELPDFGQAWATAVENEPSFLPEYLQKGLFASVITVSFQMVRP